ncbi:MAG: redoxin domain-containing protein [Candidatus Kapabacteria bacterium]|nr:redoxin domain-containing protein [Candidatus Kapabacteria bacterium]
MRLQRLIVATVFVCTLVAAAFATASLIGKKAISFTVKDQFEKEWKWEQFKGKNVLLFICDKDGRAYADAWVKPLRAAFGNQCEYVAIGDMSGVPFFIKGFVKGKIRDGMPQPLLLDWDGDIVEYYNCKEDVMNVVMVDKTNTIRYVTNGTGTSDELKATIQEVQKLLK